MSVVTLLPLLHVLEVGVMSKEANMTIQIITIYPLSLAGPISSLIVPKALAYLISTVAATGLEVWR